jgi:hypothetical protein
MFTPHKKREFGAGRLTEDQSNLVRERLDLIGLPSSPPMLKLVDHLADDRVDAPLRERRMAECRQWSLKRDIQGSGAQNSNDRLSSGNKSLAASCRMRPSRLAVAGQMRQTRQNRPVGRSVKSVKSVVRPSTNTVLSRDRRDRTTRSRIIMNRAFIARWTRMPHSIGRLSASASSHHSLSSAAFIINTAESDFRYTQAAAHERVDVGASGRAKFLHLVHHHGRPPASLAGETRRGWEHGIRRSKQGRRESSP